MNTKVDTKSFPRLGLEPGKTIELHFEYPAKVSIKLALVGYDRGEYLLLKSPMVAGNTDYSDVMVEDNVVTGRYLLEQDKGLYCTFKTSVRQLTKHPEPLLLLHYPTRIKQQPLRKHPRFTVHMPAKAILQDKQNQDKDEGVLVLVSDISSLGCAIELDRSDIKTNPNKSFITLEVFHPDGRLLTLNAYVCNVKLEQQSVHIGVSFVDAEQAIEDLLKHLLICAPM